MQGIIKTFSSLYYNASCRLKEIILLVQIIYTHVKSRDAIKLVLEPYLRPLMKSEKAS